MFFNILAGIVVFISLCILYGALRMLARKGWMLQWMRGMIGIALLVASIVLVLVALDLFTYDQFAKDKSIGTISFIQKEGKTYSASVLLNDEAEEKTFELKGDQWQMDARVIRWKGLIRSLGAEPGYRLDRLSGRYYSLEDERTAERTIYSLDQSEYGLDFWRWVQDHGRYMPWAEAAYGSATFVPMADGALYEITLTSSGLAARPLNDAARAALNQWQ